MGATGALIAGAVARGANWVRGGGANRLAKRLKVVPRPYKRKETENGAGASAQYSKYNDKLGKYRSQRQLLAKLEDRNGMFRIERFGGTNRFTSIQGFYPCFLEGPSAGVTKLPIFCLDLTAKENPVSTTGFAATNVSCFRQAVIADTTGVITFPGVTGVDNNGTLPVAGFTTLKANNSLFALTSNNTIRGQNAVLEYSNIKFLFRCPKARPGWFKMSLIQIQEQDVLPGTVSSAHDAFWQRRAKSLMYNPISHEVSGQSTPGHWPGCKVLKTWTRRWCPDQNTNLANYNGEQIRMDLFLRHNRYVNFHEANGQAHQTLTALDDDTYVEENKAGAVGAETTVIVWNTAADYKARVFLVVEGTNFDAPALTFDANNHLSFDMEVRNKWLYRSQGN